MVVVACSSVEYGETLNELANGKEDVFAKETAELKPLHPRPDIQFNGHPEGKRCHVGFYAQAVEAERCKTYTMRVGNLGARRAIMDQRDLISALLLLAEKGIAGEAYNISSEHVYQMADLVHMIECSLNHKFRLVVDDELLRPTDERVIVGDIAKLRKDTGWKQKIPMEQTVEDMLNYWREKSQGGVPPHKI